MNVTEAIHARRAYRSLGPAEITEGLIEDLATHAGLAASCFNNQPWRLVFVYDPEALKLIHGALSRNNRWARLASMIVAVFSREEDDCIVRGRNYHQFDTGMATAHLILRATELGLVAHPIAGFEAEVKESLGIPEEYRVIALVIVGRHSGTIHPYLTETQAEAERKRPERLPLNDFASINRYLGKADPTSVALK